MVYKDAPWIFKGKALYQLQLVKSDEARKYIPSNFKLVELFGYTLGGFYLARYDESPAGSFDELVALAGLVWNPPTSCAWAARVYVNNREARDHGLHHVGLPSRLATFTLTGPAEAASPSQQQQQQQHRQEQPASINWWTSTARAAPAASRSSAPTPLGRVLEVRNVDSGRGRGLSVPVCRIELPTAAAAAGPRIVLPLPSFSGATADVPGLLRYACDLTTHVALHAPCAVSVPAPGRGEEDSPECLAAVLGGKHLVTLEFATMEMRVEEPEALLLPERRQQGATQGWAAAAKAASLTAAWAGARGGL